MSVKLLSANCTYKLWNFLIKKNRTKYGTVVYKILLLQVIFYSMLKVTEYFIIKRYDLGVIYMIIFYADDKNHGWFILLFQ